MAIVDRYVSRGWYSYMLVKALSQFCEVFYFGDRKEGIVQKVWRQGYLFPFQIVKGAIKHNIDVVHYQFELNKFGGTTSNVLIPFLLLMLRFSRRKVVVTVHGIVPIDMFGSEDYNVILPTNAPRSPLFLKIAMYFLYGAFSKLCHRIIVHANIFQKWLIEYRLNPDKIVVIRHGISEANNYIQVKNSNIVLSFGVLTPRKGIETLIDAFKKMNHCSTLMIVGKEMPYYEGYVKKLRKDIPKGVIFTGYLEDDEIHRLFNISDVVVFPYRLSISASGALAWAIGHHKPTIVSDTEFFREDLKFDEALFFPIGDSEALAKRLTVLLKDKEMQRVLSENMVKKAQRDSWDVVAKEFLEVYA